MITSNAGSSLMLLIVLTSLLLGPTTPGQAPSPLASTPFIQTAYLKAANAETTDEAGRAVAVSGEIAVVGAMSEDGNGTGGPGDNSAGFAGAVYVFEKSGDSWSQTAYLKAANAGMGDFFGDAVAVSGETIVVGAYGENSNGSGGPNDNLANDAGAVYVFEKVGGSWSQTAYLKAANAASGDQFGSEVAISGTTIVVGADGEDGNGPGGPSNNSAPEAGAAYVFEKVGGSWSQTAYLKAANAEESDFFGWAVALSGNTVVVGAYNEDSNGTGGPSDNSAPQAGAAYVFEKIGGSWVQTAYLKAANAEAADEMGRSVAVSGETVVVGAFAEASNGAGGPSDNSAPAAGAAYVFEKNGGSWNQTAYLKAANAGGSDVFGQSVAVSGEMIVVGTSREDGNGTGGPGDNSANDAGAAYVFTKSGSSWSQTAYLKAANAELGDLFGWAVAVSGNTVVVGANGEDGNGTGGPGDNSAPNAGAAYVFQPGSGVVVYLPLVLEN